MLAPFAYKPGDPLVRDALDFFASHLAEDIKLRHLIRHVGSNTSTLSRRFKAATGLSPYALLKLMRLREAAALLVTSPVPIKDVAAAVGYRDVPNFVRAFAKSCGQTPAQYRAASRVNPAIRTAAAAGAEQKRQELPIKGSCTPILGGAQ